MRNLWRKNLYILLLKKSNFEKKTILVLEVRLFFKVFFNREYIKIIFFILKKVFLTSAHQNYLKILKKY